MSSETVSVKTFKKWPFASHFEAEVDEENRISSLKCVTCSAYWLEIKKKEARRRKVCGVALNSVKRHCLRKSGRGGTWGSSNLAANYRAQGLWSE